MVWVSEEGSGCSIGGDDVDGVGREEAGVVLEGMMVWRSEEGMMGVKRKIYSRAADKFYFFSAALQ